MGAWIEISKAVGADIEAIVAPLVGAWIEIYLTGNIRNISLVAPLVGAWIEITASKASFTVTWSLPSWERGLK